MTPATLTKQFTDVFNAYASDGAARYRETQPDATPVLSHVCFKFSSLEDYAGYVDAARSVGAVTQEQFNGKEITWVKLAAPLEKDGHRLEWLEMVEPLTEKHAFNGVANIGYAVKDLAGAVKLQSTDGKMLYRYQSLHAVDMAPKR